LVRKTDFHFNQILLPVKTGDSYLYQMPESFSRHINYEKKSLLAVILPQARKDGMYYEVNIKGYPRFYMNWSPLGRYDIAGPEQPDIPYQLLLEVSDAIEKTVKRR